MLISFYSPASIVRYVCCAIVCVFVTGKVEVIVDSSGFVVVQEWFPLDIFPKAHLVYEVGNLFSDFLKSSHFYGNISTFMGTSVCTTSKIILKFLIFEGNE